MAYQAKKRRFIAPSAHWLGRTLCGLCLSKMAVAAVSADDARHVQDIMAAEHARANALVTVDIEWLKAMTDKHYTHVESSGVSRTRDGFISGLEGAEYRFATFEIDRMEVRLEGELAIVTGDYHNDIATQKGLQPTKYARFIRVWKLTDDRWVNIAHQATEYQPD